MHNFQSNYDKILDVLKHEIAIHNVSFKPRKPKLSDIEIVAIDLTAQYMSIDSESQLFRLLEGIGFPNLIDRSVYNRRKRNLAPFIEQIRQQLANKFNEFEDYFVIDSMPLEVCKLARSSRAKICQETYHTAPDKGYCASQQMHFYGYKLHAVCSVNGIFESLDISKASVHDIHYLKDVKEQLSDCVLLGDKYCLSSTLQIDLFETANIQLETPKRRNQKDYVKQSFVFRKTRKRIETLFSQLCDQFMIRRNYAKSFHGFRTRILSKITSLTIIQFINKFYFNRNINNLKVLIS